MRIPRRGPLALAAIAGAAMALLVPSAAFAAYYGSETDYAVASTIGPTGSYRCLEGEDLHPGVSVCLKHDGDYIFVKDTRTDGYAAVAEWTVYTGDEGEVYRSGACVNKLGAGEWGVCNKNFSESANLWIRAARYNSGNLVDRGTGSPFDPW